MQVQVVKNYKLEFELRQKAEVDCDIQFGMDFVLSHDKKLPLMQLIFPATSVGSNLANQWNIDNHCEGNSPQDLIFKDAESGIIRDIPTELSKRERGTIWTTFAVFSVDIERSRVHAKGVQFGYKIDTSSDNPVTKIIDMKETTITNEQKELVESRCSYISFV